MSRTVGILVAAGTVLAAIAPASAAGSAFTAKVAAPSLLTRGAVEGTHYGGGAYHGKRSAYPSLGMAVQPNGKILARAGLAINCRRQSFVPIYVRLAGAVQGAAFSASGRTRLPGLGVLRISVKGTLDAQAANGVARVRLRRCRGWTNRVVLRTDSAPAGAPAMPAPSSVLTGLTSQAAGGVRLPISLTSTHNGKVWAVWDATLGCRPGLVAMTNVTPVTRIRPDGTFTRSERYSIRYQHRTVDHFRVTLTGAFHSDGTASGTLTASEHTTRPGWRYRRCSSGTQTWTARG
jgi:hypothetical protein